MENLERQHSPLLLTLTAAAGGLTAALLAPAIIFIGVGLDAGVEEGQLHIYGRPLDLTFLLVAMAHAIVELFFLYKVWRAFSGKTAGKYFWLGAFSFHLILAVTALAIVAPSLVMIISQTLAITGAFVYVALYTVWLIFAATVSAFLFLRVAQNRLP